MLSSFPRFYTDRIYKAASGNMTKFFSDDFAGDFIYYIQLLDLQGGKKMTKVDYDCALYYTHRSQWDNLLILMVRTEDHFLAKKIEHFLHAYNFEKDYSVIEKHLYSLLRYIDHANELQDVNFPEPLANNLD
jgi:hypothetical protein